jgi:glycolate oxidase
MIVEPRWAQMEAPPSAARRDEVVAALRKALPDACLHVRREVTRLYESDACARYRQTPIAVCLPHNEAELQQVLRVCRDWDVPLVPRGGGTGAAGGAMPHAAGIVLGLSRLNRVLSVDSRARTLRAQAGTRHETVARAAVLHGLQYAFDPAGRRAGTLGGAWAVQGLRGYGRRGDCLAPHVLRVAGWTIEGTRVELGGEAPDMQGLNLMALTSGAEGTLWVATEVTVSLQRPAPVVRGIWASFEHLDQACAAAAHILERGVMPAALTLWNHSASLAMGALSSWRGATAAQVVLWIELHGLLEVVEGALETVQAVLVEAGADSRLMTTVPITGPEASLCDGAAWAALAYRMPHLWHVDCTVRRGDVARMLAVMREGEQVFGLDCMAQVDCLDGSVRAVIGAGNDSLDGAACAERFVQTLYAQCVALGGSVVGGAGVGVAKRRLVGAHSGRAEAAAWFAIKRAWDSLGLLNPGKLLPLKRDGQVVRSWRRGSRRREVA